MHFHIFKCNFLKIFDTVLDNVGYYPHLCMPILFKKNKNIKIINFYKIYEKNKNFEIAFLRFF